MNLVLSKLLLIKQKQENQYITSQQAPRITFPKLIIIKYKIAAYFIGLEGL